ncbi:polysulfide reductase NrfD [Streptomyces sp. ACA25]|uniref:NrfD/PsrC family molybdoenzyme membrane anchor subunit n=1 Tax=Streptomyces sp. ACA25 TaxID=3022596 RepID=UPI002306E2C9|nr:NrfD/PsrC family molybdoenzyme membrane anchor subunit [Streptomyces sp. ACA25]MDB1090045.1 polysulfide reductase NrfD [Streptomyces sp. ACA25]
MVRIRGSRREAEQVPPADFRSYYGRPVLKRPTWKVPDVPGYLFLGGMAGASATMAAVADRTGRPELARTGRWVAAAGSSASVLALIHDLGRPARFLYMLRVVKPTSPLSVGTWILAPFSTLTAAALAAQVTGRFPGAGRWAGAGAAVLGPLMCTYTAVLLADTAVPSWHEAHPELPFVFAGSALASGAGAALLAAPAAVHGPPARMAVIGAGLELAALHRIEHRLGLLAEPYRRGRPRLLLRASRLLNAAGAGLTLLGRRSRTASALAGSAFLAAGLCTRFGVFEAGVASAEDPKYTVLPQRSRQAAGTG